MDLFTAKVARANYAGIKLCMLTAQDFEELPQLESPVLTAYLDTNPANPRNQGAGGAGRGGRGGRGTATWLRSEARRLADRLGPDEHHALIQQAQRLSDRLQGRSSGSKSLVAFVGAKAWKLIPLQVAVEEELYWGPPALAQLAWLRDEHQSSGIVVLSRSGARFLLYRMGEVEELPYRPLVLDTSQWRPRSMVTGLGKEQDLFEKRLESHYERFFRDVAAYCRAWIRHDRLQFLVLLGNEKAIETVAAALPEALRGRVLQAPLNPARLNRTEIVRLAEPVLDQGRRALELQEVHAVLAVSANALAHNAPRTQPPAVAGIEPTLAALRQRSVRVVVAAHDLRGRIAADDGSPQSLRAVVPELARLSGAAVEIVAGEAADLLLTEAGGLAAWRRTTASTGTAENEAPAA